ncbi:hypothetical protein PFISCL1PPCAC_13517, partial [Pristionchus fissidentatus]
KMQRPQIYVFFLPFSVISLLLYGRILCVLWQKRKSYNTLFYKLIRTQAVFDISYVIVYFFYEIPQDWPALCPFLIHMHPVIVQLLYAHGYVCVTCQTVDELSTGKLIILHYSPPLVFGAWIMFGQEWSWYEYQDATDRVARTTVSHAVQFNSVVTMTTSISGAVISTFCYVLIFISLRQNPIRYRKRELSLIVTSFVLFCILCTITAYFVFSLLFVVRNVSSFTQFRLRQTQF